jgi:hypothetical protein
MGGHVARMWERRGAHMVLAGKPDQRTTWKIYTYTGDNIKTDIQEVGQRRGLDYSSLG